MITVARMILVISVLSISSPLLACDFDVIGSHVVHNGKKVDDSRSSEMVRHIAQAARFSGRDVVCELLNGESIRLRLGVNTYQLERGVNLSTIEITFYDLKNQFPAPNSLGNWVSSTGHSLEAHVATIPDRISRLLTLPPAEYRKIIKNLREQEASTSALLHRD